MNRHFEDFEVGVCDRYTVKGLTDEQIIEFAREFDPQRFHLDAEAAAQTHFGGLVASGFQTQLLCFRPFCDRVLLDSEAVGSPGIDQMRWLRPWYPGDDLAVTVTLLEKRRSGSRPDRGYLTFELSATTQGMAVFDMNWTVIMMVRQTVDPGKKD